jgi:nicotinate-nucleotide adenylyltransferase
MKKIYDRSEMYFLVGEDNLKEIWTWKDPEHLFRICRIVVIGRRGERKENEPLDLPGPVDRLDIHRIDLSSSEIRARVKKGLSIRYLVPPRVERYIYDHSLYR